MPRKKPTSPSAGGDVIQATIGDHASQVAVGKNNRQTQTTISAKVSEADLRQVASLFDDLKKQIEQEAPPDKKAAAIERVEELKQEVTSPKPQVVTMEYVKNWFTKNLPSLLGGVTSIMINPIVGKVIEASTGIAAEALKKQFGPKA